MTEKQALLTFVDVCVPCYLRDHHNRDGEYLFGLYVDNRTTTQKLMEGLIEEVEGVDVGQWDDKTFVDTWRHVVQEFFDDLLTENGDKPLWPDLGGDEDDEDDEDDDFYQVQAWFLFETE